MDYESGEFGRGGQRACAADLVFRGRLGEPFVAFALDRARRLSLTGWIRPGPEGVRVAVQGPQALVDAFEIVCSLGPIQADVQDWSRTDLPPSLNLDGFERR